MRGLTLLNNIPAAYALLEWAKTPMCHGGNPYCRADVVDAERTVAAHEGRDVETFAADWDAVRPQAAPVEVERATVAPGHESAQAMAHTGSAAGVSGNPAQMRLF